MFAVFRPGPTVFRFRFARPSWMTARPDPRPRAAVPERDFDYDQDDAAEEFGYDDFGEHFPRP